jgi:Xaa-Pro aminopeptidase
MRLKEIKQKILKEGLDAFLVFNNERLNFASSYYVSGFTGDYSVIIVTKNSKDYIITDSRFYTQIEAEVKDFEIVKLEKNKIQDVVNKIIESENIKTMGIQSDRITHQLFSNFKDQFKCELVPKVSFLGEFRQMKTEEEKLKIVKAAKIATDALEETLNYIKVGVTENEIAARLEYFMKIKGSQAPSFETIVASGYRSALPHGLPSDRKLREGDFLVIDYGAIYEGYHSDITRTFVIGEPTDKHVDIYETVRVAQEKAYKTAKAGMTGKELDSVAREYIDSKGYSKYFGHGLGHGVGIEIHELPFVSYRNENPLPSGAVITIEPGIYIPDFGGVRIEDDFFLTENGAEILSNFPRELNVLK